ncbi:hypothetical protein [Coleofasciculus sp. G2-EDA-02]
MSGRRNSAIGIHPLDLGENSTQLPRYGEIDDSKASKSRSHDSPQA